MTPITDPLGETTRPLFDTVLLVAHPTNQRATRKRLEMLELEYIEKCIELFNAKKISGLELAELLTKEVK
jgi:hypothetical protein